MAETEIIVPLTLSDGEIATLIEITDRRRAALIELDLLAQQGRFEGLASDLREEAIALGDLRARLLEAWELARCAGHASELLRATLAEKSSIND